MHHLFDARWWALLVPASYLQYGILRSGILGITHWLLRGAAPVAGKPLVMT
jgi:hypothetical protein